AEKRKMKSILTAGRAVTAARVASRAHEHRHHVAAETDWVRMESAREKNEHRRDAGERPEIRCVHFAKTTFSTPAGSTRSTPPCAMFCTIGSLFSVIVT